jgi:hypothetical protein
LLAADSKGVTRSVLSLGVLNQAKFWPFKNVEKGTPRGAGKFRIWPFGRKAKDSQASGMLEVNEIAALQEKEMYTQRDEKKCTGSASVSGSAEVSASHSALKNDLCDGMVPVVTIQIVANYSSAGLQG